MPSVFVMSWELKSAKFSKSMASKCTDDGWPAVSKCSLCPPFSLHAEMAALKLITAPPVSERS
eukprot:2679560-Karenia_brevis.AAC.1